MKYFKHVAIKNGVKKTVCLISEADPTTSFPESESNRHYVEMMADLDAVIEEIDDTPE